MRLPHLQHHLSTRLLPRSSPRSGPRTCRQWFCFHLRYGRTRRLTTASSQPRMGVFGLPQGFWLLFIGGPGWLMRSVMRLFLIGHPALIVMSEHHSSALTGSFAFAPSTCFRKASTATRNAPDSIDSTAVQLRVPKHCSIKSTFFFFSAAVCPG